MHHVTGSVLQKCSEFQKQPGLLTVSLWLYVCPRRPEELPLYPLRQVVHPEGSPGIAHGHPHRGEEPEVRLL